MSEKSVPSKLTEYGFRYGAARVDRLWQDRGYVGMSVVTAREAFEIRVTPSGILRITEKRKPYPHEIERFTK